MQDKIKVLMICHGNSGAIHYGWSKNLVNMGFFRV